jgi:hypothetical protein
LQLKSIFLFKNDIEDVKRIARKKVYIPLHWYPEATTDYWINSGYHCDYYASLFSVINIIKELGYEVITKEHPHFIFNREYSALKKISENSILLSPKVSTKQVLDIVDFTVVWNGSTGIEALCNNSQVYKVVNSYYGDNYIDSFDEILKQHKMFNTTQERKNVDEVVEKVLRTSFRTY